MSVDKYSIKNAVTGIEFTEESKQRIFDGIERKKTLKQKIYIKRVTTGIVVTAIVFLCVFINIMQKNKSIITVYAMTQDGNEKNSVLIPEHRETIYWIPESNTFGQIYSGENEKLTNNSSNCVSECEFEIVVYNESKEISYEEVIKFELVNGECIVTLKK